MCIPPRRGHYRRRVTNGSLGCARDREPVGRNFRKFQNDVVARSAGVRAQRAKTHGRCFAHSLFTVTYVTRNEPLHLFISLFPSVVRSVRISRFATRSTPDILVHIDKTCVYENNIAKTKRVAHASHTCTASGNVAHLPRFPEPVALPRGH